MKKRRIAIASVLKPVDDTRMYEKMGQTLDAHGYEVIILGKAAHLPPPPGNIRFVSIGRFERISFGRLLARIRVFRKLVSLRPNILIVTTHELMLTAIVLRVFYGVRIVYDIQENYYRNIRWTKAFPFLLRPFLAAWVRIKEYTLITWFHRCLMAEKIYARQLFFITNPVILENKAVLPLKFTRAQTSGTIKLLFTGTLSPSSGVFDAIDLAVALHASNPNVILTLAGMAPQTKVLNNIKEKIVGKHFIQLQADTSPLSHSVILNLIAAADYGLILYPPSPNTAGRIPTKLYEYMAARLPIILRKNKDCEELAAAVSAAVVVDFPGYNPSKLLNELTTKRFYTAPTDFCLWQTEAPRLLTAIDTLP